MIRDQVVDLLKTFGPLPSMDFVKHLGMKKPTVINALCVAHKHGDVWYIHGQKQNGLWDA